MAPKRKKWKQMKIPKCWRSDPIRAPRIRPLSLPKNGGIADLVGLYSQSGSFQAGRLATACKIYQRMIQDRACIGLTLAGAMTPTGMGGMIAQMIGRGAIDWIISTGANLYHDLHYALNLPVFQGDFRADDCLLKEKNINRIYDIFLTEEVGLRTDVWILETIRDCPEKKMSTAEFHHFLGKALLEDGVDERKSLIAAAARYEVPIYTSSPGDSEIGLNLAYSRMEGVELELDPLQDVLETTAIVNAARKNGVMIVGGGSPKNFYLQTQPMLRSWLGIDKKGHDYDIQITVDAPYWGGLSGATPEEAVSWGKIKPDRLENSVVVYSDATIALPIIFGYVLEKCRPQAHKRIFRDLKKMLDQLEKDKIKLNFLPKL